MHHARPARPYQGYLYAYPHKTAYRPLRPAPGAARACGRTSRSDALFLYLHVPFCEMRCGFCNLFTRIGAPDELTTRATWTRWSARRGAVRDALGRRAPVRRRRRSAAARRPT